MNHNHIKISKEQMTDPTNRNLSHWIMQNNLPRWASHKFSSGEQNSRFDHHCQCYVYYYLYILHIEWDRIYSSEILTETNEPLCQVTANTFIVAVLRRTFRGKVLPQFSFNWKILITWKIIKNFESKTIRQTNAKELCFMEDGYY